MKSKTKTQKRRRRERKTDYKKRMNLLKSGIPRLVFRKTNKYVNAQYVESKEAQDKVVLRVASSDLLNHGWPKEFKGSLKSIPATYLTGFLAGKKIQENKLKTPIVDLGMERVIVNSRIFGFLKGLIDSGLEIPCDEEKFPSEEKIRGKMLKKEGLDFDKIKQSIS